MRTKICATAAAAAVLALTASACSSNGGESGGGTAAPRAVSTAATVAEPAAPTAAGSTTTVSEPAAAAVSVAVPFTADNGTGAVTISGDGSPVAVWFANQPGEVSLDLVDADATDPVSVVEELISFWFFQDDDSGDVPPSIFVSASGGITDSVGTSYVVEAQPLPPAPGTATTTTADISETAATTTAVPGNTENPTTTTAVSGETATTTTTTTASAVPETTTTTTPVISLQVQVLNGSGVAGAAGRLTERLSQAGYAVLSPGNAQRYRSSAVYFREGWESQAREILETSEIEQIEQPTPMPAQFSGTGAAVIVLLGTDTAPAVAAEQSNLRPEPDFGTRLPLGDDVPRDRYVPGLANIQIFTQENDADPETFNYIHSLQQWLRYVANFRENDAIDDLPEARGTYENLLAVYDSIEEVFDWLGFTPQNVCGAPAGYSFTDLIKPTREFSEETQNHRGDTIFTTDRLIELHGGERINPENNLDFYIREAAQTAHDSWRIAEILDETEAPQLILCEAWKTAAGDIPEFANGVWYMLLTPGFQPRENLISQGTYHVKEISRNGNRVQIVLCHPALGSRYMAVWWRDAGYRAEATGSTKQIGCQAHFEEDDYISEHEDEPSFTFAFGERVFSASDLLGFPRS